ncbi:MAG: sigma-70 family RNA polymerase sigma factor [Oscillospiraceae bacterium]
MNDEEIIDLYFIRSENAISETKEKFGSYCHSIAMNILSNKSDSEECENDTYLALWNSIPPTRPNKLSTFIARLTRNIALSKYDYNKAKKRNSEFDFILSELEEMVSSKETVETAFECEQLKNEITKFLRTISYENRNIFLRRYWFSDSIRDISVRFNMSESKVKSSLFRTRNKLKLHLLKEGINL